jgi:cell division septal protein FtsQ
MASSGYTSVRTRPRLRIKLLAALLGLALLLGGWLWFRDSPLVAVRQVRISGVQGRDAASIEAALTRAARKMTTLDVRPAALRAAVARFRVVGALRVTTSFPHGLHIQVLERLPVAAVSVNGQRTAVAADGAVLGPAWLSGTLPSVAATPGPGAGQSVRGPELLATLTVLGAAPRQLLKLVERAYFGPEGLTLAMRNGLLAYFGDSTRPHAKWLALASVLAARSAAGASYVDVRLPERPAAGFPGGSAPEARSGSGEGAGSYAASTSELAASLAGGGGAGASTGSLPAGQQGVPSASPGVPAAATPAEASAGSKAAAPSQQGAPSGQTSAPAATQATPGTSAQEPSTGTAPGG